VRYRLALYNAGSQTVVLKAPDDEARDKKSLFKISIRGGGSETERGAIDKPLRREPVWLQVVPSVRFKGKYLNRDGQLLDSSPVYPNVVVVCPLLGGDEWDVRVTHIRPWIEGIRTNLGEVQFHIKMGTSSYIVDAGDPPVAHYFDHDGKSVNTEFAHYTDAKLSDPTNARMAGGAGGEVTDPNIDKRGIFGLLQLSIPDNDVNAGLSAVDAKEEINLDIHFSVIFRASPRLFAQSGAQR
jgi:hypothetical protein